MQLRKDDLNHLSKPDLKFAGGDTFLKDYKILMSFLESNFIAKNDWRI